MKKLEGKLEFFYETGMDGIAGILNDCQKNGYDSLYFLEEGDFLRVYDEDNSVLWEGNIDKKMAEMYSEYFNTGSRDRKWLKMFYDQRKAELIKPDSEKGRN